MTVNRSDFQRRFKAEPDSGDRFIGMDVDDGSGDPFITDLAGMAGGLAPLIAVDTELSSRFLLRAADEFSGYSNGVPTTTRTGQTYNMFGGIVGVTAYPTIVSGHLTLAISSAAAGYAQVDLGKAVTRVGGRFKFGTKSTDNGSAVLIAWAGDYAATPSSVPNSPCHLAITPVNAVFGVWNSNTFTQLASWTFATALSADDATYYTSEVYIDKATSTCTILLPDGTVKTVTDSLIGSIASANWACWEMYRPATTDSLAKFSQTWASDTTIEMLPLVKWAATQPVGLAKATTYAPASGSDVVTPTSATAIDSTNLKVSMVAPASGKILIECNGIVTMSGSTRVFWSIKSGAATWGTKNVVSQQYSGALTYRHLITGLTPNSTYDFVWQHWALASSTCTFKLDDPNGYQATMSATPIHT
mgnify:CR=1 FL=1